ncbi:MAG TPA: PIG-L deacetylase family protein [Chloroflexota bacterium]|nr:PIG-L deacetylase family protein [Chloroflexota bacterium]
MLTYVVVAAHPDDPDFGVAGTAAVLAQQGHSVHYVLCTSGDAGSDDPSVPPEDLVCLREEEQTAAGRILGLSGVHFLRFADGELEPSLALRKALVRVLRELKADVLICQDPRALVDDDGTYLNHPDHRAAGQAAVDAAFPGVGNPSAYRDLLAEGLQPHKLREVWLYFTGGEHVNHWVDISSSIEQKIAALEAHDSQIGEWARSGGLRAEMLKWASEEASRHQLGYQYAESFQRIVLVSDEEKPAEAAAVEAQTEE